MPATTGRAPPVPSRAGARSAKGAKGAGTARTSRAPRPRLRVVREDERPSRRDRLRSGLRRGRELRRVARAERDPLPRTVAVLLTAAFLLTGIGLVMVLSASSVSSFARYGSSFLFLKRQAVYAAIGTVVLLVTVRVPYRRWQRWALPLLVASVALLALALHPGIGTMRGGSSRWIQLGPVTIQPSEFTKLTMVVFVATILTRKWRRLDEPGHLAIPLAPVLLVVCGLIILQRDLGTTAIIALTTMIVLFAAGVRLRYLLFTGAAAAVLGWVLIIGEGYRKARLLSFWDPWKDAHNTGYQLIQSLIGLGSGGLFGVGLGASRQKWMYIPNAHTDFIFSILGEELGMLGEMVVLALFAALVYCGIRIAARVTDTFGRLLAIGIVGWLAVQTTVNLGAVTGLLPVTGVPLPFVSFGGSSLIVTLAAVGILANIGRTAATERVGREPAPARRSRPAPRATAKASAPRGSRKRAATDQARSRGAAVEAARRGHPAGTGRAGAGRGSRGSGDAAHRGTAPHRPDPPRRSAPQRAGEQPRSARPPRRQPPGGGPPGNGRRG